MSTTTSYLPADWRQYIVNKGVREPSLLAQLRRRTQQLDGAVMQISPEQGQFMRVLVRMLNVRKAIEIGVFTGYSSICVAEELAAGGQLIACDVNETWAEIAREYWARANLNDRIDLRLKPAAETLQALIDEGQDGQFDFAFIDADKANYQRYYEQCLKLLRPGGVVLVDNVLWSGRVLDQQVQDEDTVAIRRLNDQIAEDDRVVHCMLPLSDGLTLAVKR